MFAAVLKEATGYFDRRALLSVFFPSLVFWSGALLTIAVVEHRTGRVIRLWEHQPGLIQSALVAGCLAAVTFWSVLWQAAGELVDRCFQGHWAQSGPFARLARHGSARHTGARRALIERDLELERSEVAATDEYAAFPTPGSTSPATTPATPDEVDRELDELETLLRTRVSAAPLPGWSRRCRGLAEQLKPYSGNTHDPGWERRLHRFAVAAQGLSLALKEAELALREQRATVQQELFLRYPQPPVQPLPTALGNIIRAAEQHPRIRYGLDPVVIWSRLQPVLPTAYADGVRGAKAGLDLLCTIASYVCLFGFPLAIWVAVRVPDPTRPLVAWPAVAGGAVALVTLWVAAARPRRRPAALLAVGTAACSFVLVAQPHLPGLHGLGGVPVRAALALLLTTTLLALFLTAYRGAVQAALAFAEKLRTAFDLHRGLVLDAMGLERPQDLDRERLAWAAVCAFLYRGAAFEQSTLVYAPPPAACCCCAPRPGSPNSP